jgi:hypothetical protein
MPTKWAFEAGKQGKICNEPRNPACHHELTIHTIELHMRGLGFLFLVMKAVVLICFVAWDNRICSLEEKYYSREINLSEQIAKLQIIVGKSETRLDEQRLSSNRRQTSGANREMPPASDVPVSGR